MTQQTKTLTPQEVKIKFFAEGRTFKDWAKENGYHFSDVYRVLNGQSKAKMGKGHEIAVKLGLKTATDSTQKAA